MPPADWNAQHAARAASDHPRCRLLEAPGAHVAVLSPGGIILRVNRAWLRFALLNGDPPLERIGVGADYLQVCARAAAEGDPFAAQALDGLCAVATGRQERFLLEYPCHAPGLQRWFRMLVTRRRGTRILVAHEAILLPRPN